MLDSSNRAPTESGASGGRNPARAVRGDRALPFAQPPRGLPELGNRGRGWAVGVPKKAKKIYSPGSGTEIPQIAGAPSTQTSSTQSKPGAQTKVPRHDSPFSGRSEQKPAGQNPDSHCA